MINYRLFDLPHTHYPNVKYTTTTTPRHYQLVNKNTMQIELKTPTDVDSFFNEVSKKARLTSDLKENIKEF